MSSVRITVWDRTDKRTSIHAQSYWFNRAAGSLEVTAVDGTVHLFFRPAHAEIKSYDEKVIV